MSEHPELPFAVEAAEYCEALKEGWVGMSGHWSLPPFRE